MTNPHTRQLAVVVTYQEREQIRSPLPIIGPDMELVGAGGRVFLYDVALDELRHLADLDVATDDCRSFRCELAGWADGAIYLRLILRCAKNGDQPQFRRVDMGGSMSIVADLPSSLVSRDIPLSDGGLISSGGSSDGIRLSTADYHSRLVLVLDSPHRMPKRVSEEAPFAPASPSTGPPN